MVPSVVLEAMVVMAAVTFVPLSIGHTGLDFSNIFYYPVITFNNF